MLSRRVFCLAQVAVSIAASAALIGSAAAAWGGGSADPPGGPPRSTTAHVRTELINFPYSGRGDDSFSFHYPYVAGPDGSAVAGWTQLGSAVVTGSDHGRDVVRLTSAAQGLQGVLHAKTKTHSMDFNGYFDIFLGTASGSSEPADGMGFFFSESVPTIGSAMGITHTFKGLGVVVDTFSNSRKRNTPHLFAYVSNGDREWNADTDGTDIELTAGCKLQMDTPTRISVQLLDSNLHVAVSTNQRHSKWHTCFRYNNVPMPFRGGGYLSFAGETGYFFSNHDVLNAGIVVGDIHEDPAEREAWHERRAEHLRTREEADRERREMERKAYEEAEEKRRLDSVAAANAATAASAPAPEPAHASAPAAAQEGAQGGAASSQSRDQPTGTSSVEELAHRLDGEMDTLYEEIIAAVVEKGGSGATLTEDQKKASESVRTSIKALSAMYDHMFLEIARQTAETADAARVLQGLKRGSDELKLYTQRFTKDITELHESAQHLRGAQERLREEHFETHDVVIAHAGTMKAVVHMVNEFRPHGILSTLIFLVLQAMLLAGFAVVHKMGPQRRKDNRVF